MNHFVNVEVRRNNACYKTHSLEELLKERDLGGCIYEFSKNESLKIGKAKDSNKVVSSEPLIPTGKIIIESALNELIFSKSSKNERYRIFYGEKEELTPKKLFKTRQSLIHKLQEEHCHDFVLLERLKKQQQNLLKLSRENEIVLSL